jgi:hypothetical protein
MYQGKVADIISDGRTVRMAGQDWVIAPLTFRQMKRWQTVIDQFSRAGNKPAPPDETPEQAEARLAEATAANAERVDKMIDIILTAMQRNYPELTRDEVEDLCDMQNTNDAYRAALGLDEAPKSGEAKPALTPAAAAMNGSQPTA